MRKRFDQRWPVENVKIADDPLIREQIFRLRYGVYVEEMGKPYPGADHRSHLLTDSLDSTAILLYVTNSTEKVIASVRCNYAADVKNVDGLHLQLASLEPPVEPHVTVCSRLVVAKEFRRQRAIIHSLLCAMYSWGLDHDIQINLCHTAEALVPFFRRLGYVESGAKFLDEHSVTIQQPMKLHVLNLQHLAMVKSPFAMVLDQRLRKTAE